MCCAGPCRSWPNPASPPPLPTRTRFERLDAFIRGEVESKQLPALSIALVDDQKVVWARGYGFADAAKKKRRRPRRSIASAASRSSSPTSPSCSSSSAASSTSTCRSPNSCPISSRSTPSARPITLRQLLSHRSGLVREPPVGNYFDPTEPSLKRTVESLNRTELVYEPETRIKYSNAAIAVAGFVLEETQKQPFARYMSRTLLQPLGMTSSSFEPDPVIAKNLARSGDVDLPRPRISGPDVRARAWRRLAACTRRCSTWAGSSACSSPAARRRRASCSSPKRWRRCTSRSSPSPTRRRNLASVFMFWNSKAGDGSAMAAPVYGFATELAVLPDDKLGVVVIAAQRHAAIPSPTRIANAALGQILAVKQGKPLPTIARTTAARPAAGVGKGADATALGDTHRQPGRTRTARALRSSRTRAVPQVELRPGKAACMVGRPPAVRARELVEAPDDCASARTCFSACRATKPEPSPARWAGLIGEYGWDHNTLYILEKDGQLHALIEWFFLYPAEGGIARTFSSSPIIGLYHGEKLVFTPRRRRAGRRRSRRPASSSSAASSTARTADVPHQAGQARSTELRARQPWPPSRRRRRATSASRTWST